MATRKTTARKTGRRRHALPANGTGDDTRWTEGGTRCPQDGTEGGTRCPQDGAKAYIANCTAD